MLVPTRLSRACTAAVLAAMLCLSVGGLATTARAADDGATAEDAKPAPKSNADLRKLFGFSFQILHVRGRGIPGCEHQRLGELESESELLAVAFLARRG